MTTMFRRMNQAHCLRRVDTVAELDERQCCQEGAQLAANAAADAPDLYSDPAHWRCNQGRTIPPAPRPLKSKRKPGALIGAWLGVGSLAAVGLIASAALWWPAK